MVQHSLHSGVITLGAGVHAALEEALVSSRENIIVVVDSACEDHGFYIPPDAIAVLVVFDDESVIWREDID